MHHSYFESPPLPKPGDLMRVVAPAGPFDRTLFFRGLGFLAQTFRVRWGTNVFHRTGFLAGSREERAFDLTTALQCPEARVIVCARGGVGSSDLLHPLLGLDHPPKWFMGFSDITALHAGFQRNRKMSIHGPNVTSLGIGNAALREQCIQHLLNPLRRHSLVVEPLVPGNVKGPLVGGNLAVLHDLCVSNAWQPPANSILFIEEIAEAPYRIYRMLSSMQRGGHLQAIAGLLVGQITLSSPGPHRRTAREVVKELCEQWRLPAAWGVPSGHDPRENCPLTLGGQTQLTVTAETAHVTFNA